MVADIGTQSLADSYGTDTAKAQKAIIANRISGEGCEANPDWRPGWIQAPPTRLIDGSGSPPADAWARIAGFFESDETASATDAISGRRMRRM